MNTFRICDYIENWFGGSKSQVRALQYQIKKNLNVKFDIINIKVDKATKSVESYNVLVKDSTYCSFNGKDYYYQNSNNLYYVTCNYEINYKDNKAYNDYNHKLLLESFQSTSTIDIMMMDIVNYYLKMFMTSSLSSEYEYLTDVHNYKTFKQYEYNELEKKLY